MHKAWRSKNEKVFSGTFVADTGSRLALCGGLCGRRQKEKVYPVILLQGYSGPKLFNQDTGEKAWGLDFDKVKEHVLNDYGKELANGAKEYAKGNPDPLVDTLGTILLDVMDPIACNADGSSKYNLDTFPKAPRPRECPRLLQTVRRSISAKSP